MKRNLCLISLLLATTSSSVMAFDFNSLKPMLEEITDSNWTCTHTRIPLVFSYKSRLAITTPDNGKSMLFSMALDGVMPDWGTKASVLPKKFIGVGNYTIAFLDQKGEGSEEWLWTSNFSKGGLSCNFSNLANIDDPKAGVGFIANGKCIATHIADDEASDTSFMASYNAQKNTLYWGYSLEEKSTCKRDSL